MLCLFFSLHVLTLPCLNFFFVRTPCCAFFFSCTHLSYAKNNVAAWWDIYPAVPFSRFSLTTYPAVPLLILFSLTLLYPFPAFRLPLTLLCPYFSSHLPCCALIFFA